MNDFELLFAKLIDMNSELSTARAELMRAQDRMLKVEYRLHMAIEELKEVITREPSEEEEES